MDNKQGKGMAALRRRKPPPPEELRRMAALRLLEKLEADSLSAADLLRVIALESPETQGGNMPGGDWVLAVEGES